MREYSSVPAEGEEEAPNPLDGVSFTLDGVVFRCLGRMSVAEVAELARQAMSGADTAEAALMAMLAEPLAQAFGEEEYARFRHHVREHKTPDAVYLQILSDLQEEIKAAVEAAAGRPTQQPSPSGSGEPDPDGRISRLISFADADVKVIQHPAAADHKAPGGTPRPRRDAPSQVKQLGNGGGGKQTRRRTG